MPDLDWREEGELRPKHCARIGGSTGDKKVLPYRGWIFVLMRFKQICLKVFRGRKSIGDQLKPLVGNAFRLD